METAAIPLKTPPLEHLEQLIDQLDLATSLQEKKEILYADEQVNSYLTRLPLNFSGLDDEQEFVILALLAIGQGKYVMINKGTRDDLFDLADKLVCVERFYTFMGGLIGYHLFCLKLYAEKDRGKTKGAYHKPSAFEISSSYQQSKQYGIEGLRYLDKLAEIYPVGGAADRLSARKFQVAATRRFCGKSLLKRLIEDVEAREYLYRKIFGKAICIPIVMMTSDEKKGTTKIREHLESENWFGRDPDDFFLMSQPLVPAMTPKGKWVATGACKPIFKPGGHGVIWKVAHDSGALKWLKARGKEKALVRQINNPIAGVDDGLLVFTGYGFKSGKDFGFASCPRIKHVSEGVDVVIETEKGFSLTNIEYCDFDRFGVKSDADLLANTNILFVDLLAVQKLLEDNPVPGMLINAKKMKIVGNDEQIVEEKLIRLESTMQNLADGLVDKKPQERSYITCNRRIKTISPIKREYEPGGALSQTPEQCMIDMQTNAKELLNLCGFEVGAGAIFEYHPALGPLYDVTCQKLRSGHLYPNSHFNLEIAEVDIEHLTLKGGLVISSECLGEDSLEGRCRLKGVTIENEGLDHSQTSSLSCKQRLYKELCEIKIGKGGEFEAENVVLKGNMKISVPANTKVTAVIKGSKIEWIHTKVERPSWKWSYSIDSHHTISLKRLSMN